MTKKILEYVPSISPWGKQEFIDARRKQIEATKDEKPDGFWEGAEMIFCDPGDEIICDWCNAEVITPMVWVVEYGRRVACDDCVVKHYGGQSIKYRPMYEDGTLGKEENVCQA